MFGVKDEVVKEVKVKKPRKKAIVKLNEQQSKKTATKKRVGEAKSKNSGTNKSSKSTIKKQK